MENQALNTALLVMDVQPGILDRLPEPDAYLANAAAAVKRAHEKGIPVIYVVVGFRPGAPEASAAQQHVASRLIDPHPAIAPEGSDVVVVKRRVSAFSGSDLEILLRARNIRHLVLAGISTSGVVLSTVREASDKELKLTVLSDLCADYDPEAHAVLMSRIFPRQATVTTCEKWLKTL
ncbi:MAG: cysteine hydrolase [Bacteroidetes bacterium]|nr:cysteine hydrolase [Bacteroidota bacterium]